MLGSMGKFTSAACDGATEITSGTTPFSWNFVSTDMILTSPNFLCECRPAKSRSDARVVYVNGTNIIRVLHESD